jgi:hypothetical protein
MVSSIIVNLQIDSMKIYLLFFVVFIAGITSASGQKEKEEKDEKTIAAPANIKAVFEKAFPHASKVKWVKEDDDYEVSFMQNENEMSLVYDSKGALKETETVVKVSELPSAITAYVKQHYKGASIHEAAKILLRGGEINYEAEVNNLDLVFDSKGKFLKAVKD